MPRMLQLTVSVLVIIAAGVFGYLQLRPDSQNDALTLASGTVLAQRTSVAEFNLVDQAGQPFTRRELEDRWSLLFSGFTHCPDICPTTLALMARLEQRLQEAGTPLQLVFLSVDPQRDTPEQMAEYLGYFSPGLRGATGNSEDIRALSESLGLAYVRVPGGGRHYNVDHASALVLIDPEARLAGYFRPPLDLDALARDLQQL
ncbi:MAG: SCO family protein [Gammaproteobacteria bacterium]|nr:SCO family protein [Gammaproteobacteria bacterium]